MGEYARTLAELKKYAVFFWPKDLVEREASASVLPLLLKTQDKFISILNRSGSAPDAWKESVDAPDGLNGNLFLKHLMVLTDLGGERLKKYPPFGEYFKDGEMSYVWREKTYGYKFRVIQDKVSLDNAALRADGKGLVKEYPLTAKMEDVVMLLLHAGASVEDTLPEDVKSRCMAGSLLGEPAQLEKFVRQNYMLVSRQIGGATANALGHLAQDFVFNGLRLNLPGWQVYKEGTLPGVSHTGGKTGTTFDVVAVSPDGKYFGVEVSFQFTTNSVIEQKAGRAEARRRSVHDAGHWVCYVVDGAGNMNIRESAVRTICDNSDCTVALSSAEMGVLADFMVKKAGGLI